MSKITYHSMRVRDLSLMVRLGCTAEERSVPQEVRVGVDLRFLEAPRGCLTDQLEDTICYAELSQAFRACAESQEFHLVEKMGGDLYEVAKNIVRDRAEFSLIVHKVKPPVTDLKGGVEYRIGSFL